MKSIEVKCPAKINLSLDVTGKRADGYHELEMIMQTVDLFDKVKITVSEGESIEILSDSKSVPCDESNTCYKAAKLFYEAVSKERAVKIFIEKNIPQGAGMAGGSTDAAGVLKGLNEIEGTLLSEDELLVIAKKVGADVPFCIKGGCCLCRGIGEILTPLEPMKNVFLVVAKPEFSVSTMWVYKNLVLNSETVHPDTQKLIEALRCGEYECFKKYSGNTLEAVTAKSYDEIEKYKEKMYEYGAFFSMMTGSGPSVFGVFREELDAFRAFDYFKGITKEAYKISL